MDIYSLIRFYQRIKSPKVKLLGILVLHLLRRRYLNMVFDPSLACNLRCRMCYFSDPETRKFLHGTFTEEDIEAIARSLFHRVLRLQIGCGAEPTTYKSLPLLVKRAHEQGIPHISITTNGQLLTPELLNELAANGLNELTISAHGMSKEVYEAMMPHASHERFLQTADSISQLKAQYPQLKIRLNYTINRDNIDDLQLMPQMLERLKADTLQLRPIQQIGDSDYDIFSMDEIATKYDDRIVPIINYCQQKGITCLYPERENLVIIEQEHQQKDEHYDNNAVDMLPYFQLSPHEGWKEKIDPYSETFEDYCRRTHRVRFILKCLVGINSHQQEEGTTKALNYNIKS